MKRRWILFAVLVFALLAFVPVVNGSDKMGGWLKVWLAYRLLPLALAESGSKGIVSLLLAIIGLHIGLSVSIGIGLDRLARRIERRGTSNHISDGIQQSADRLPKKPVNVISNR